MTNAKQIARKLAKLNSISSASFSTAENESGQYRLFYRNPSHFPGIREVEEGAVFSADNLILRLETLIDFAHGK